MDGVSAVSGGVVPVTSGRVREEEGPVPVNKFRSDNLDNRWSQQSADRL